MASIQISCSLPLEFAFIILPFFNSLCVFYVCVVGDSRLQGAIAEQRQTTQPNATTSPLAMSLTASTVVLKEYILAGIPKESDFEITQSALDTGAMADGSVAVHVLVFSADPYLRYGICFFVHHRVVDAQTHTHTVSLSLSCDPQGANLIFFCVCFVCFVV